MYVFQTYCEIQILMYRNFDFLVKALTVVGVLFLFALMSLFIFRQKIVAIFRPKEIMITPCIKTWAFWHVVFKDFAYFLGTPISRNIFEWLLPFTSIERLHKGVYFLGKHCYQEYLYVKILHSKLFQGEYLFPGGCTYLLVTKYWWSSYSPVNNYWWVLFAREYLLTVALPKLVWICINVETPWSLTQNIR